MKAVLTKLPLCLPFLLLVSCSNNYKPFPGIGWGLPGQKNNVAMDKNGTPLLPWEVWTPYRDLAGDSLKSGDLMRGDEFLSRGKRREALEVYSKASTAGFSHKEYEALALRKAATELAAKQAGKALDTISKYFKQSGKSTGDVGIEFALVLAYAYGTNNDIDQALAWFSRVHLQSNGRGYGEGAANFGVKKLLMTLPTPKFEALSRDWRSDEFINGLIGEERYRRNQRGYVDGSWDKRKAFWEGNLPDVLGSLSGSRSASGSRKVGVLVSLSDKFASLEKSTRDGIQFAFDSDKSTPKYELVVKDTTGGREIVASAVKELASQENVTAIVGPLITESAREAAEVSGDLGIPIITLSKSGEFQTSPGVFRLGATVQSQIESLLATSFDKYGIRRYGIVYPESANGAEFLAVLRKELSKRGLSLVTEIGYNSDNEGILIQAGKTVEQSDIEALLLPDNIDVSSRFLSTLSAGFRKRVRILGTATWDNPTKIANSQALFEGALFVSPFFTVSGNQSIKDFIESYKARFGTAPNFLAAQGFDAGTLVLSALKKSQSEGLSFVEALKMLPPYEGLTGNISVNSRGEIVREFRVISVTKNGLAETMEVGPGSYSATKVAEYYVPPKEARNN